MRGQDDAQLAGGERGARAPGIDGAVEPNARGEAAERALGEVKRRVAMLAGAASSCGRRRARRRWRTRLAARRRHAGKIGDDFDARVGLDDVERRRVFCARRAVGSSSSQASKSRHLEPAIRIVQARELMALVVDAHRAILIPRYDNRADQRSSSLAII